MRSPLEAPEPRNNRQQDETRTATNAGGKWSLEIIDILFRIRVCPRRGIEREPAPPSLRIVGRELWKHVKEKKTQIYWWSEDVLLCAAEKKETRWLPSVFWGLHHRPDTSVFCYTISFVCVWLGGCGKTKLTTWLFFFPQEGGNINQWISLNGESVCLSVCCVCVSQWEWLVLHSPLSQWVWASGCALPRTHVCVCEREFIAVWLPRLQPGVVRTGLMDGSVAVRHRHLHRWEVPVYTVSQYILRYLYFHSPFFPLKY